MRMKFLQKKISAVGVKFFGLYSISRAFFLHFFAGKDLTKIFNFFQREKFELLHTLIFISKIYSKL